MTWLGLVKVRVSLLTVPSSWIRGRSGVPYIEVLGVDVRVLGKVEVLLGHEYALYMGNVN